jgi:hypothetical protein
MPEPSLSQNLWAFARKRGQTLDLFPEYLESVIAHWNDLFFLSLPTLPFVLWWYLGEPPMLVRVIVFGGVFLSAGYYAWRREALENRRSIEITLYALRPYTGHYSSGESHVEMTLVMAVWNSTEKPSVITGWKVEIPALAIVRSPDASSDDEISTKPIAPGARCLCELRLNLKGLEDSEERTQVLQEQAFEWFVSFRDVAQREHRRAFSIPALGTLKAEAWRGGYVRLTNENSN